MMTTSILILTAVSNKFKKEKTAEKNEKINHFIKTYLGQAFGLTPT